MTANLKIISLIIAIKRRKNNSILFLKPNHVTSKQFNLSPQSFSKLISLGIEKGWIEKTKTQYKVKKLSEIFKEIKEETNFTFSYTDLLNKNKGLNVKNIIQELFDSLIDSNIVKKQEFMIRQRQNLLSSNAYTVKKAYKLLKKKGQLNSHSSFLLSDKQKVDSSVYVSKRMIASVLGVSEWMASKILNNSKTFERKIINFWVPFGANLDVTMSRLSVMYPKAVLIPFGHYGRIKVCFGSIVVRR